MNSDNIMFGMLHYTSARNGQFAPILGDVPPERQSTILSNTAVKRMDNNLHEGVSCDHCGVLPIVGIRYRCSMCADYDLCELCMIDLEEAADKNNGTTTSFHDSLHLFYRVRRTSPVGAFPVVLNRSNCVHTGINCSLCHTQNIQGYLYKCQQCPSMNICEACEAKGLHDPNHARTKISNPSEESIALAKSQAEIIQLKKQLRVFQSDNNANYFQSAEKE